MSAHRLVVLRHAKSDWPAAVPDHERPLADRGRRDAPVAGRWIAQHLGPPDAVIVSDAVRTRQTWALASEEVPGAPEPRYEPRVYAAPAGALLAVLRELPEEVGSAVLVGHNPGCEDLVRSLAGSGDPGARAAVEAKYPTSGAALLELGGSWSELAWGSARLVAFTVPRG